MFEGIKGSSNELDIIYTSFYKHTNKSLLLTTTNIIPATTIQIKGTKNRSKQKRINQYIVYDK